MQTHKTNRRIHIIAWNPNVENVPLSGIMMFHFWMWKPLKWNTFKAAITDYNKAGYREANGNNIAFVHGWPTQITTGFSSFFNSIGCETSL